MILGLMLAAVVQGVARAALACCDVHASLFGEWSHMTTRGDWRWCQEGGDKVCCWFKLRSLNSALAL